MRKPKPIDKQLRRHLRNRKALSVTQGYEHVKPTVSRSAWFNWLAGRTALSVKLLQRILDHLGLHIVIVDKDGKTGTGKEVK